jgi:hypothetical protein
MNRQLVLANTSRTVARIGSILVFLAGFPFLLFVGLQLLSGEAANLGIYLSLLLLAGLIAGMAIAWRKEALGATISLASLAATFVLSSSVIPGVGSRQGISLFAGPINLIFALLIPGFHLDNSPLARWVPFISWMLTLVPAVLFYASWWLRKPVRQK